MRIPGLAGLSPITLGVRVGKSYLRHEMPTYASALAYTILFTLFPFMVFLVAMVGFLGVPEFFDWLLEQAQATFPEDAYNLIEPMVQQIQVPPGGLLSISVAAAIWASSGGVRALIRALNRAYEIQETRPPWLLWPLSILYTIGLAALMVTSAALMLIGPNVIEWLVAHTNLSANVVILWNVFRFPLTVVLLVIASGIVYSVAPNVKQPFRAITPGAVLAVTVWLAASWGFSFWVSNFGDYNATYGSLAGVIITLFYFFLSCAVLLAGAEVNAEIYRETAAVTRGDGVQSGAAE